MKNAQKMFLIFSCLTVICFVGMQLKSMKPTAEFTLKSRSKHTAVRPTQQAGYKTEPVWMRTADGMVIEMPLWYIDQMKVLQVLFLQQKGQNSKNNPLDAAMVTSDQLTLLQMALKNATDPAKLELFCENLKPEEKTNLINVIFTLEAQGLAALLMNSMFSPEIQEKLGASYLRKEGVMAPVIEYLKTTITEIPKKVMRGSNGQYCVAYSPDSNYIVSGGYKGRVILWNGKTGEKVKVLEGHNAKVTCVAYSPDGNYIVSGSGGKENNLILWDGKTGDKIKVLQSHNEDVRCVAFSPNGNYIVSGSEGKENNLILWDISPIVIKNRIPNLLFSLKEYGSNILPQDIVQLIGQNLIELSKVDITYKELEGHNNPVVCVGYSPDGNYIISGSEGVLNNLILWNGKTGEQIKILKGYGYREGSVWCVAYSPDGNCIVSGSRHGTLILWDGKTGEEIKKLYGHDYDVCCVAYSPDGNYIVSGSGNGDLILWDGKAGEKIKVLYRGNYPVECVAYSPNGNYIASGSGWNLILWNGKTGDKIKILKEIHADVRCVVFSPDGNYIVSASGAGMVDDLILWKLVDPQALNFIATQLNIAQARLLYRLYLAKLNNVSVVLGKKDPDYQIYITLPDDVQQVIKTFFPFEEPAIFIKKMKKEKAISTEKVIQEKINHYKFSFFKTGASLDDKIKTIKIVMKDLDKNSVDYQASERLLRELEQEAAFEG